MATNTLYGSLAQFIRERMSVYDSAADTSEGSRFDRTVVQPLIRRLGPDPTDTEMWKVIEARLLEYDPQILTQNSAVSDLFISALDHVLEPIRLMLRTTLLRAGWSQIELLTEEEADILADCQVYSRDQGANASGTLRLLFVAPQDVQVTLTNVARAGTLKFIPSRTQTLSMQRMSANMDGQLYYFDVDMVAEQAGSEYNVDKLSISNMEGVPGLVGVRQNAKFTNGLDRQSNIDLRDAVREDLTVRNLVTEKAFNAVLKPAFPSIDTLTVVGRGGPLMDRDVVRGPVQISGLPGGIRGYVDPELRATEAIHVGGFTDLWVGSKASPSAGSMDILNVYDEGVLVFESSGGVLVPDGGGEFTISDEGAFFTEEDGGFLPVQVGDYVLIEGRLVDGEAYYTEFEVQAVSARELTVTPAIPVTDSESGVRYEVRRRLPNHIALSPDTLVAVESDVLQFDSEGDPLVPIPGPTPETEPGPYVATRNVASANLKLPLVDITSVEILDPITQQPTGITVPEAAPVVFYVSEKESDSVYWVRALFRSPTRAWAQGTNALSTTPLDLWNLGATAKLVPASLSANGIIKDADLVKIASITSSTPFTSAESTRTPRVGDMLEIALASGDTVRSRISAVNAGGPGFYQIEDAVLPALEYETARPMSLQQGTTALIMQTQQEDNGFYYFEFLADLYQGEIFVGDTVANPGRPIDAEGWSVMPRLIPYAFSVEEDPLLIISKSVPDGEGGDLDMSVAGNGLRINYRYDALVPSIQTFLDDEDENPPSEDILVRSSPVAKVHTSIYYRNVTGALTPVAAAAGISAVTSFVNATPGTARNATELSNVVEGLGSTGDVRIRYPFYTIVECAGRTRSAPFGLGRPGRLISFLSPDGYVTPEGVSPALEENLKIARYESGNINVINQGG